MNTQDIKYQLNKYNNVQGLMKYINTESLKTSFRGLNGRKALGIDRISKEIYGSNLDENISNLLHRLKSFEYYPKTIRRVNIRKSNGKMRKLGISCIEDKIVQKVMTDIMNSIYENIFIDSSYGFRPGRSCHMVIDKIVEILQKNRMRYIISLDIEGFFDNINKKKLIEMISEVVKDKHFIKYISRYLNTGILEKGEITYSDYGTPQGGIISPILANIYLHYVLDKWFTETYQNNTYIIRYADDFIIIMDSLANSKKIKNSIINRFKLYDLKTQEEKSKIIHIKDNKYSEFDYLGFNISIIKEDKAKIRITTSNKNIDRKYKDIRDCINNNQIDIKYTCVKVNEILRGYYNYYGLDTNIEWLYNIYQFSVSEIIKHYKSDEKYKGNSQYVTYLVQQYIVKPYIKHYIHQ